MSYRIRSYAHPGPPRRPGYRPPAEAIADARGTRPLGAGDVVEITGLPCRLLDLLSSPYAGGPRQLWALEPILGGTMPAQWVAVADRVALAPTEEDVAEERAEDRRSEAWGES